MIHSAALLVLLAVLATARITRLVNEDAILDGPRRFVVRRAGDTLAYFVQCPWCVSVWVGMGVAAATVEWGCREWLQLVLLGLAASYVTGLLALLVARMEVQS